MYIERAASCAGGYKVIVMSTFNHESAVSSIFLRNILRILSSCGFMTSLRQANDIQKRAVGTILWITIFSG
jgi:hypothetical protein